MPARNKLSISASSASSSGVDEAGAAVDAAARMRGRRAWPPSGRIFLVPRGMGGGTDNNASCASAAAPAGGSMRSGSGATASTSAPAPLIRACAAATLSAMRSRSATLRTYDGGSRAARRLPFAAGTAHTSASAISLPSSCAVAASVDSVNARCAGSVPSVTSAPQGSTACANDTSAPRSSDSRSDAVSALAHNAAAASRSDSFVPAASAAMHSAAAASARGWRPVASPHAVAKCSTLSACVTTGGSRPPALSPSAGSDTTARRSWRGGAHAEATVSTAPQAVRCLWRPHQRGGVGRRELHAEVLRDAQRGAANGKGVAADRGGHLGKRDRKSARSRTSGASEDTAVERSARCNPRACSGV